MALEESSEENTDPPEEHIYHIRENRESACPSSDKHISNKECLESQMNGIQGIVPIQRITRLNDVVLNRERRPRKVPYR